jgi:Ni/Co efflux regulator RcnB
MTKLVAALFASAFMLAQVPAFAQTAKKEEKAEAKKADTKKAEAKKTEAKKEEEKKAKPKKGGC